MFRLNKSLSKLKSIKKKNSETIDANDKKKKLKKANNKNSKKIRTIPKHKLKSGVISLHNIPYGFFENEMKDYFSQFGKVARLRLSRSRKTHQSRGYAYIEFESEDVAKIAANTMNNYLMFNHLLRCEYIPPEKVHSKLFRNYNKPFITTVSIHKNKHNKDRDDKIEMKMVKERIKKVKAMEMKLKNMNIEFKCHIVNVQPNVGNDETVKSEMKTPEKHEMIVHESDDEIVFKTPPNSVRVTRPKLTKPIEVISMRTEPSKRKRDKRFNSDFSNNTTQSKDTHVNTHVNKHVPPFQVLTLQMKPSKGSKHLKGIKRSLLPKYAFLRAAASVKRRVCVPMI